MRLLSRGRRIEFGVEPYTKRVMQMYVVALDEAEWDGHAVYVYRTDVDHEIMQEWADAKGLQLLCTCEESAFRFGRGQYEDVSDLDPVTINQDLAYYMAQKIEQAKEQRKQRNENRRKNRLRKRLAELDAQLPLPIMLNDILSDFDDHPIKKKRILNQMCERMQLLFDQGYLFECYHPFFGYTFVRKGYHETLVSQMEERRKLQEALEGKVEAEARRWLIRPIS